jgi:sugar lactone lactonase YvrE
MPEELRARLDEASRVSGRSLNREIVSRLESSLSTRPKGEELMIRRYRRPMLVLAATLLIATAAATGLAVRGSHHASAQQLLAVKLASKDLRFESQGTANGGQGGESAELLAAMQQFDNARTAPSTNGAFPGAYTAAFDNLQSLETTGGAWDEITDVPYDSDDPDYRDYYSNSSGGNGLVTGRVTGLAADDSGDVYAAGAVGGVWRSTTGGGNWTPIADGLPSLSSGDLELNPADGSLWYATGEANTGGTSYAGTGVYRLEDPTTGTFTPSDRVGGTELESTTINSIRFDRNTNTVWVATLRGIYSHSSTTNAGAWDFRWAPNPSYLPGGADAGVQQAGYKNIVNDLVIDPKDSTHLVAAVGWRSGDSYDGFYESTDGGTHWNRVNPTGGLDATDIGYANFAYSNDGKKLYVINQSPKRLNKPGFQNTLLDGIYESDHGLLGPWNRIASSDKLGSQGSGSALGGHQGQGYSPGVQSWYNQSIAVDPANPNHVIVGLEEVYETYDGGSNWKTIAPYWNFYFSCWGPDALYPPDPGAGNRCPQTAHTDQHAVAIGEVGGVPTLFVGNDGGAYKRALNGPINKNGNAMDWVSLNDGSMDALQYYYVGVGKTTAESDRRPDLGSGDSVLVSGGLQDNGGSLLRPGGAEKMVSNFGGDGGDVLVDPDNGCNIVQEYVYLTMEVTQTCANPGNPDAFLDLSKSTTYDISPPDVNAQFIAPFTANDKNIDQWVAAGNSLWYQDKGFAIRHGSEWQKIYTLASPTQTFTAVTYSGDTLLATWCGPCSASGAAPFARGAVVGTFDETKKSWTVNQVSFPSTFPNRYLQGAAINPNDSRDLFIGINGFSRRYTDGPGAGLGHVYESPDGGVTWNDITANMPDIPVNDVVVLPDESLAVATDLGVLWRQAGGTQWTRLGSGLPTTTVMDLTVGPDGKIYAGTHGRGIWRIEAPEGSLDTPTKDVSTTTASSGGTGGSNGSQGGGQGKGGGKKPSASPGQTKK